MDAVQLKLDARLADYVQQLGQPLEKAVPELIVLELYRRGHLSYQLTEKDVQACPRVIPNEREGSPSVKPGLHGIAGDPSSLQSSG